MKNKIEKTVYTVVAMISQSCKNRNDVLRSSSIKLNEKYGINVAESDKAHGYLIDALNEYCYENLLV